MDLTQQAMEIERKHYEELTKPHTEHEEVYNKLSRLDTKIKSAKERIHYLELLGENTTDLQYILYDAEKRRDEADIAWSNEDYGNANRFIGEAYDLLNKIPPLPPAPPAPPVIPEAPEAPENWLLIGGIIAGVIIIGMVTWLVMLRQEVNSR